MTAAQPNLLELAKQGDARAIATMLNTALQPEGITVRAGFASDCLMVTAESQNPPDQADLVGFMRELLTDLSPARAKRVVVQGRVTGQPAPVWHEAFDLVPVVVEPEQEPEQVATIAEPEAMTPEPPHVVTPPSPESLTRPPQKTTHKTSKKSLLIAGASLTAIALCLLIGKQAFEQTTSASNALLIPEQKAPSSEATIAPSSQPNTISNQPKTENTTASAPSSKPTVASQATLETTIVASLKPGSVAKNNVQSSSPKSSVSTKPNQLVPTKTTISQRSTASQPKATTTATQKSAQQNNGCESIHVGMNQKAYQQCLSHGMTRPQMVQVMGSSGDEMARVGSVVTYKWVSQENKVIATFHHDRLISKSLVKLQ
jgi:hypothetical protein